jgi:acetyltransferase-like isoleucine patch superfamily enzyme
MIGFIYHRLGTMYWTAFYRVFGRLVFTRLGKGVVFEGWVDIPQKGGKIVSGDDVRICRLVEFSVPPGGQLVVEDGVFIGRGVMMSVQSRVGIGRNTMVAEFVSIHDNDHIFSDPDLAIERQGFVSEPLEVGANCWIGAKAVLLRRSGMGNHCVLGAGAVLTKRLPSGIKAAGVPAAPLAPMPAGMMPERQRA